MHRHEILRGTPTYVEQRMNYLSEEGYEVKKMFPSGSGSEYLIVWMELPKPDPTTDSHSAFDGDSSIQTVKQGPGVAHSGLVG